MSTMNDPILHILKQIRYRTKAMAFQYERHGSFRAVDFDSLLKRINIIQCHLIEDDFILGYSCERNG